MSDATIAELAWYFRDSELACEAALWLGSLPWSADLERLDAHVFEVDAIEKASRIRRRLASLPEPHADVLAAMFEERDWPPRVTSLFSWPGVAVRTLAARWALALEGQETRTIDDEDVRVPTGDVHRWRRPKASPDGMMAYLSGLTDRRAVVGAIREETRRRVSEALAAYEDAAAADAGQRRAGRAA